MIITCNRYLKFLNLLCFFGVVILLSGCSSINPSQKPILVERNEQSSEKGADETSIPDTQLQRQSEELDYSLDMAEYYYALGVNANRDANWEDAQFYFERSLEILSEIDVTDDEQDANNQRFNTLLKEIEQDYRYTLTSLGILSDESSHSAFLELFADIKNFKKLRENLTSRQVEAPDSVTFDMPIESNQRVENSLVYLQTVGAKHFSVYLARMGKYKDLMLEIIREHGLPEDLIYLPLIESGFNPKAYSYARASGPWQFISSTARLYGLKRNWWYDERRDFVKSTHAACRYLKFLYEKFGCWKLALASYNGGEGRIGRQMKRQGTDDFWELKLHRQTMNYVPLFMAATIIAKSPERYGFGHVEPMEPVQYDIVSTNKVLDLKVLASRMGVDYEILKGLNPELLRGITPPNYPNYEFRVPSGFSEKYAAVYPSLPGVESSSWVTHTVRRGEALSTIASRYGVSMSAIASVNKLRNKSRIYAGQRLLIPAPGPVKNVSYQNTSPKVDISDEDGVYTVRRGDTLWDISRRFGTTITQLKSWNNLRGRNPRLYPGMKIKVTSDKSGSASSGESATYIVKRGDTLWSIAKAYGTTVENLRKWNNLSLSALIRPGDRLAINPSESGSGKREITHTVKRGDTLWSIAERYKTTVADLRRWNNLSLSKFIMPGDKLKIYLSN